MVVQFFTLSLSLLYETNEQQFSLVYVLIVLRNCPKMVVNLAFLWSIREKTQKNCWREKVIVCFLVYIVIDHRNDQKWLQLSISMVDKRIDVENCCREKVIVRKKTDNSFP